MHWMPDDSSCASGRYSYHIISAEVQVGLLLVTLFIHYDTLNVQRVRCTPTQVRTSRGTKKYKVSEKAQWWCRCETQPSSATASRGLDNEGVSKGVSAFGYAPATRSVNASPRHTSS